MIPRKYTPEQVAQVMSVIERYKVNNSVKWERLIAENPENIMAIFIGGNGKRKIQQLYRREINRGPRQQNMTRWTEEEMTRLLQLATSYTNAGGAIDWKRAESEGAMNELLVRHTFKDCASRYHYHMSKARNAGRKNRPTGKRYRSVDDLVKETMPTEVQQKYEALKEQPTLNFCPHCGCNLQVFNTALRVINNP